MPEDKSPIQKALEIYQTGRNKLYETSGLKDFDELGQLYQGLIKTYMAGKIDVESAVLAIRFSELLDNFRENPTVKDEMANFEKEMFNQPLFKAYLAATLYVASLSAKLQRRTAKEGIAAATKTIVTAESALKKFGAKFSVK